MNATVYGDATLFSKPHRDIKLIGQGAFGKVSIVQTNDRKLYYVKRMQQTGKYYNIAKREIEINMHVTKYIPNYVSQLLAANLIGSPSHKVITSEQWFEYLPGMDMIDAINTADTRHPKYIQYVKELYCMSNTAIQALHSAGYIHRDIKPDNLFVVQETSYTPLAVKLIDFGTAYNIAEDKPATLFGTTKGYSPYLFPDESHDTHPYKYVYPGKPHTSNNYYAMDVLWQSLFGRMAPPVCNEMPVKTIPIHRQPSYYSGDETNTPTVGGTTRSTRSTRSTRNKHRRSKSRKN